MKKFGPGVAEENSFKCVDGWMDRQTDRWTDDDRQQTASDNNYWETDLNENSRKSLDPEI